MHTKKHALCYVKVSRVGTLCNIVIGCRIFLLADIVNTDSISQIITKFSVDIILWYEFWLL